MPGFWVEPEDVGESRLVLRGDEAHHLTRVRRYGPGDEVEAVDGVGCCYRVRVERVALGAVEAEILARLPEKGESPVRLILAPALLKGQRFDLIVEKATEVGVAGIMPLFCERGVVRVGKERKIERWQRLAQAATKQCGRSRVPKIDAPRSLYELLGHLMTVCDTVLLATPGKSEQAFAIGQSKGAGASVGLLVGPEGGFTHDEVERARGAGVVSFAWGERVLRSDTAGIVLAALVLHAAEGFLQKEGR